MGFLSVFVAVSAAKLDCKTIFPWVKNVYIDLLHFPWHKHLATWMNVVQEVDPVHLNQALKGRVLNTASDLFNQWSCCRKHSLQYQPTSLPWPYPKNNLKKTADI